MCYARAELCALLREAAERGDTATWPKPAVDLLEVADRCAGADVSAAPSEATSDEPSEQEQQL